MGGCISSQVEVIAVEEVKKIIIEELVSIAREKIIPEVIHQMQFTEVQLDNIAKNEQN